MRTMNKRVIDEEEFVKVCNEAKSMAESAMKLKMRFSTFRKYAVKLGCYKPNQGGKGIPRGKSHNVFPLEEILNGVHPQYQSNKLRIRLISEGYKEHRCEICGLSEWNGKPIPIELHHKDGNTRNNSLDNLQIVCLNCHAQTDTFRSKNDKSKF